MATVLGRFYGEFSEDETPDPTIFGEDPQLVLILQIFLVVQSRPYVFIIVDIVHFFSCFCKHR